MSCPVRGCGGGEGGTEEGELVGKLGDAFLQQVNLTGGKTGFGQTLTNLTPHNMSPAPEL